MSKEETVADAVVEGPGKKKTEQPEPQVQSKSARRHSMLKLSFVAFVLVPAFLIVAYLYVVAKDQYVSRFGFTVRQDEVGAASLVGGFAGLSTSGASDLDILYEFIRSPAIVEKIDARLDLEQLYGQDAYQDPFFKLRDSDSIEALTKYWSRIVDVSYASNNNIMEVSVRAFTAADSQMVAQAILEECEALIDELSAVAQQDAIRFAEQDLLRAEEQLKEARKNVTLFRAKNQIVDVNADIQIQMGLLTTLQQQLGTELINFDLLVDTTRESDPRIEQTKRRISALEARIEQERAKFGAAPSNVGEESYAELLAEFERLSAEREFSEKKFVSALSNHDAARSEAQQKSRYLTAYQKPTTPQISQYPQRLLLSALGIFFCTMMWAILVLVIYSVRDRH